MDIEAMKEENVIMHLQTCVEYYHSFAHVETLSNSDFIAIQECIFALEMRLEMLQRKEDQSGKENKEDHHGVEKENEDYHGVNHDDGVKKQKHNECKVTNIDDQKSLKWRQHAWTDIAQEWKTLMQQVNMYLIYIERRKTNRMKCKLD